MSLCHDSCTHSPLTSRLLKIFLCFIIQDFFLFGGFHSPRLKVIESLTFTVKTVSKYMASSGHVLLETGQKWAVYIESGLQYYKLLPWYRLVENSAFQDVLVLWKKVICFCMFKKKNYFQLFWNYLHNVCKYSNGFSYIYNQLYLLLLVNFRYGWNCLIMNAQGTLTQIFVSYANADSLHFDLVLKMVYSVTCFVCSCINIYEYCVNVFILYCGMFFICLKNGMFFICLKEHRNCVEF